MSDKASQGTEEEPEEEELAVKTREPLSGNTQANPTFLKKDARFAVDRIILYVLHSKMFLLWV